jgi:hypothetical protein
MAVDLGDGVSSIDCDKKGRLSATDDAMRCGAIQHDITTRWQGQENVTLGEVKPQRHDVADEMCNTMATDDEKTGWKTTAKGGKGRSNAVGLQSERRQNA